MAYYPNLFIPYPFSGIQSGFIIHPYHVSRLYDDLSGVENIIGLNPLNGWPSLTARISGLEGLNSSFVSGATSSTDSALALWDGTTGKRIKDSVITVDGAGSIFGATSMASSSLSITATNDLSLSSISSKIELASSPSFGINLRGGNLSNLFVSDSGVFTHTDLIMQSGIALNDFSVRGVLSGNKIIESGIRPVGFINNGGSGNSLVSSKSDNIYSLKGVVPGPNIQIITTPTDITINLTGISSFAGGLITSDITPTNSGTLQLGTTAKPFATGIFNQYATTRFSGNITDATYTLNWDLGSSQAIGFTPGFLTGVTLTLTGGIPGSSYILETYNNPSGTAKITWPTNVKWQSAASGVVTASGNSIDMYSFYYNGSSYFANGGYNFL